MSTLRTGDEVLWSGSWGTKPQQKVTVKTIQVNEENGSKEGTLVHSIDWRLAEERNIIVDFDENTHWAWGFQIVNIKDNDDVWYNKTRRKEMDWQIIIVLLFMTFCSYGTYLIIQDKENEKWNLKLY